MCTPLHEEKQAKNKIFSSETNLKELKETPPIKIASDPNLVSNVDVRDSQLKETNSEGNIKHMTRQISKTQVTSFHSVNVLENNTLNIKNDNIDLEIKVKSSDSIRIEVELAEEENVSVDGGKSVMIREQAKNKLQRLGQLYSGT